MQTAEAERILKAEKEALDAEETIKMTAREDRFFKLKKACEEIAASTSFEKMYELMITAVGLSFCPYL
jgi:hypothetical protein